MKKAKTDSTTPSQSPPSLGGEAKVLDENVGGNERKSAEKELQKLQDEKKVLEDNWKRALADYQNLVRRTNEDRTQYLKLANVNLLAKLLPTLDIIEMAATHSEDLGVQMAAKQFAEALKSEGVEPIMPNKGDVFDSSQHECIETIENKENPENSIAEVSLKGYRAGDFVLRPARVKVYKTGT